MAEPNRIDQRNSPSRSSCIIDRRMTVPFLCLQIAKLRSLPSLLRSIVGTVAMNERPAVPSRGETGAPRISNDFGPGRSTTGSRPGLANDKRICSCPNLFTGRRPARYGADLVKTFHAKPFTRLESPTFSYSFLRG